MFVCLYTHVGILAGAWPCGTIALVAELFGSESKSQVYGSLHTFVQENKEATSDLCKSTLLGCVVYCYPVRMSKGVKQSVLSVSLFVWLSPQKLPDLEI
jgi:hypothetical protein